jgi:aminoglycoside phosphotransferase (APT) family kinase protein
VPPDSERGAPSSGPPRAPIATPIDDDLAAVAASLGSPLVAASTVGWGDAHATLRLLLGDGRAFAVRRLPGPDGSQARRIESTMTRFAAAGLPTADAVLTDTAEATWLAVPWIDGLTGAAWLDEPDRACRLADRMGHLVRRIARIDPLDVRAIEPHALQEDPAAGIERWMATPADLAPAVRDGVAWAIRRRREADQAPPTVAHGDYAPINVIVDAEGEITALLDFEHVTLGPPNTDVAWWGWVVRHHHPEAWAAAWPTFRSAAGVEPDVPDADLQALALFELARRAATAADAETRVRWLARLTEAAAWRGSSGDQAT